MSTQTANGANRKPHYIHYTKQRPPKYLSGDCCTDQIPSKTLTTSILELLPSGSINSLYDNSIHFYAWWMEYLAQAKPWLNKRGHRR